MPLLLHLDCEDAALRERILRLLRECGREVHVMEGGGPEAPLAICCGPDAAALRDRVAALRASGPVDRTAILAVLHRARYGDLPALIQAGADACLEAPFSDAMFLAEVLPLARAVQS